MPATTMLKSKFQIFVENMVLSFLTIIKIFVLSKFCLPKIKCSNKSNDCIILGNGPSLNDTIANNKDFLTDKDLFAVNFFARTSNYSVLKPRHYVITSPQYWAENFNDVNTEGRKDVFEKILKQTTWDIILHVPALAKKKTTWEKKMLQNKHISISYFNTTPVDGIKFLNHWFFKLNLGMPRPHNVLIPSIKISIDLKYKKVFLFGADHSWLKDIFVTDDNVVLLTQKHFYDKNKAKPNVMHVGSTYRQRTLAEVLTKFVYAFNSYFVLKDYAKENNVKIFNATKGSYIDAFDRYSLPN
ncbi:MAG: hypothetical protein DRJ01_02970 [Bacteroidetes bacterium]|nr:MAG: hypothetical protein DRJ01_02970 [Bacteroidota bacterium]